MESESYIADAIFEAWRLCNRITIYLIENLPPDIWDEKVPGYHRKTIQMIAGHLHNTRCMWLDELGKKFNLESPGQVNRYKVTREKLIVSLNISSEAILKLLKNGIEQGGSLPGFSLDAVHFQNYLVAHEAHHRGQIVMTVRLLGHKLPEEVTYGLWKWSNRSKEV